MSDENSDSDVDCLTEFVEDEFNYKWRLKALNLCELENGQPLKSCKFPRSSKYKNFFHLKFYPKGDLRNEGYISLYVFSDVEIKARVTLSLIYNKVKETRSFYDKIEAKGMGYPKFISQNKVFGNLNENASTILINCSVSIRSSKTKKFPEPMPFPEIYNGRGHALSYESIRDCFPDIELEVSGTVFPAHRFILASHSKVFAAMFQHDMEEKLTRRVKIPDFQSQTVLLALELIYSGELPPSDVYLESALEVLRFADKYDILFLRKNCANYLFANLSVENVYDVLLVADMLSQSKLKASCMEFIRLNLPDSLKDDEWKCKLISSPHLLIDIVELVAREKNSLESTGNLVCHQVIVIS